MDQAVAEVLKELRAVAHPEKIKGRERFAIPVENALGVSMPDLRHLAKLIGEDQVLAEKLWQDPHHESKLLATLLAEPKEFSIEDADRWVKDVYSWDLCDQLCMNLLHKTTFAWQLPARWIPREEEFVRRAGIAVIAVMAVHYKKVPDDRFLQFVPLLKSCATDERNFVKKAVSWAVRQIGKRSAILHPHMITLCDDLLQMESKSASWITRDALRELESEKIKTRLGVF